jgi:hypothetical protein
MVEFYVAMCPQGVDITKRFAFAFPNVNVVSLMFYVSRFVDEGIEDSGFVPGSDPSFAAHCKFQTNSEARTASCQI